MKIRKYIGSGLAGLGAGSVNGLFGAGGGMVLVPLLTSLTQLPDDEIFPSSVSIIETFLPGSKSYASRSSIGIVILPKLSIFLLMPILILYPPFQTT